MGLFQGINQTSPAAVSGVTNAHKKSAIDYKNYQPEFQKGELKGVGRDQSRCSRDMFSQTVNCGENRSQK